MRAVLGVIGGSGLYDLPGLENAEWRRVDTPWGRPSDDVLFAELAGHPLRFLPRHGRGHRLSPTHIDYRANIDALKRAGATDVISISAVGSLRENLSPGTFVIVDQFIDRTVARERTFFGKGLVAHVAMANPVCGRLASHVAAGARHAGVAVVEGGTYVVVEGPQFSTRAESELFRSWGADVVGMTNLPEARLAREAELCYSSVAMVTDFDCWHPDHETVTVDVILKCLLANADNARNVIRFAAPLAHGDAGASACACRTSLDNAIVTQPDARDADLAGRLDAVAGRVLHTS